MYVCMYVISESLAFNKARQGRIFWLLELSAGLNTSINHSFNFAI